MRAVRSSVLMDRSFARLPGVRTARRRGVTRQRSAIARSWARLLWLPLCVVGFAGSPGAFVAVGEGGVIVRSTDEGATWTAVKNTGTNRDLGDIIVARGGILLADGDGGTIVRSVDGGASWLPVHGTGTTADLGQAIQGPNGTLLVSGDDGTVVRSVDGGLNWVASRKKGTSAQIQTLITEPRGALVAVCDGGQVVRSTDDGLTWSLVVSRRAVLQGIAVTQKGTLVLAGGEDSPQSAVILRSVDGGSRWSEVKIIGAREWLVSVTAESGGSLIAFDQAGGELRSVDDGLNWSRVDAGTKDIKLLTLLEQDRTILAAGDLGVTDQGTIFRSVDGGATWSPQYRDRKFFFTGLFTGSPGTVLAIGNYHVHSDFFGLMARSSDGGITWSRVSEFGTKRALRSVVYVPYGAGQNSK
jgi:photosystem II stability/assembly factor-like uncharacterized protein